MSKNLSLEEKRAKLIISTGTSSRHGESRSAKMTDSSTGFATKKNQLIVMHAILGQKTIGISYVRELKEMVEKEGASRVSRRGRQVHLLC